MCWPAAIPPNSRKSYVIMPLMIMSAGAAAWLIWGRQRIPTFQPRTSTVVISTVCVFGCLTSLLMTSLFKMEMKRLDLLAHLIVHNKISDDLHVDWNPELQTIWRRSSFDTQTLVDRALIALGHQPRFVHFTESATGHLAHRRAALALLLRNCW